MKLSELIARLAEMLEEHGDVPVLTWDSNREWHDVLRVRFEEGWPGVAKGVRIE